MLTELQQKLKKRLYEIQDDRAFVALTGGSLDTDDEINDVLNLIDSGDWEDPDEIMFYAIRIHQARHPELYRFD